MAHFIWYDLIWHGGKFLGIDWSVWKAVGWTGQVVFFTRFFVQWYFAEKYKRVVVPAAFWWLSLTGTLILLTYSIHKDDSVFIVGYLFAWIPYLRNLVIHHRYEKAHQGCTGCGQKIPPEANFCPHCGTKLQIMAPTQ